MSHDTDPCPYCGRDDFGNPGARSQHVESHDEAGPAGGDEDVQTLETVDDQQAAAPAPASTGETAGEAIGKILSVVGDETAPTEQRKDAVKTGTALFGEVLSGMIDQRDRRRERAEERAKNAEIEPVEDKPSCVNCGATFSAMPPGAERVRCPECRQEYRVF